MTEEQRVSYWSAAIAKAREAWPNDPWGIALNSTEKRTQCHLHFHIGRLLPNITDEDFVVVDKPAEIPLPKDGDGIWIHTADGNEHSVAVRAASSTTNAGRAAEPYPVLLRRDRSRGAVAAALPPDPA